MPRFELGTLEASGLPTQPQLLPEAFEIFLFISYLGKNA
jgi:hypothetical protein